MALNRRGAMIKYSTTISARVF